MQTRPEKGSRFLRKCGDLKKSEKKVNDFEFIIVLKNSGNFPDFFCIDILP